MRIVSSCSGESDNRAQGAEGLADEEGSINLAEGYSLLLESIGPIGAEYQVKLSFHPSLPKDEYLNKRKKCAIARKRLAFFVGMWYNICVGTYAYVRG